jgi:hypothetical protein
VEGSRWAAPAPSIAPATWCSTKGPNTCGRCDRYPWRIGCPEIPDQDHAGRRPRGRRATKLTREQRLARRSSRPELTPALRRPGYGRGGVAGVTSWHEHSARERSNAKHSARASRQFVKRASETDGGHVPGDGHPRARDPRPRDGPPSSPRRRSRPGCVARQMEARQGRDMGCRASGSSRSATA